jgi:hypothetical protein
MTNYRTPLKIARLRGYIIPFLFLLLLLNGCKPENQDRGRFTGRGDMHARGSTHARGGAPAGEDSYISGRHIAGSFPLSRKGHSAPLFVSTMDYPGVARVAELFRTDIGRVTGTVPELLTDTIPAARLAVLIGTVGKNPLIDRLVEQGALDAGSIAGKWEAYLIQVLESPFPGVQQALVIAGSDKRGTIYGMFDFSSQMGVSPWYWWADVPVKQKSTVYVKPGPHTAGEPAVKYRGIFINDEAPALSGWVEENYGAFNHEFYEHVFELILRMKGNFLWPAMWGRAFYDDDPVNPQLADLYGIVIGTSHHEPMMRAHVEWSRYGSGPWNYEKNEKKLREFWTEGIERMGSNESLVTIGMRGDGDEPMTRGTAIALLEKIVRDQRDILEDVTGKPAAETPQVWALYKEVQEYYDQGMRVPEDVTLLLCDDNWGNIRRLPWLDSADRQGGYGIYYHYDYVGGPRNYKWLNTNQIERVWEQMHLAYSYGVNRIWIVNVGDIKPMEFPIQFFLDYAWNPGKWPAERLPDYYLQWACQQFGEEHAGEIAGMIARYTRYNSRRKPELLSPRTYSLIHQREAERIVSEYNELAGEAEELYAIMPVKYRDAFFELVYFPIMACANLNELYVTAGRNHLYAGQQRAATNWLARRVEELFGQDSILTGRYHTELANGKWNHMMSQTHIGYTYWQQPERNAMPAVEEINLTDKPLMGVAIEGSDHWWPEEKEKAVLPGIDPWHKQATHIEVFNRGRVPFEFTAEPQVNWIKVYPLTGKVEREIRLRVEIEWKKVPGGEHLPWVSIIGPGGETVKVYLPVRQASMEELNGATGFIESNGYISMEAAHYSRAVESGQVRWKEIPGLGRTLSGMTAFPVTAPAQIPGEDSPRLEYDIHLFTTGKLTVRAYFSPTLDFHGTGGLKYAVSIDDEPPVEVNLHADESGYLWNCWVSNNINIRSSEHQVDQPGNHILKFWMVDPAVVLQKIEMVTGDPGSTYLGPPESHYAQAGK